MKMKFFNFTCYALMRIDVCEEYPDDTTCDFLGYFLSIEDAAKFRDQMIAERRAQWDKSRAVPVSWFPFDPGVYEIVSASNLPFMEGRLHYDKFVENKLAAAAILQHQGIGV